MRRITKILLSLLLCVSLAFGAASPAAAYTEKEKRMAKNWLSSHGYSPTRDGAYAAYNDWLHGKWWDEFGPPEGQGEDDDEEPATAATQKSESGKKRESEPAAEPAQPADGQPAAMPNLDTEALKALYDELKQGDLSDLMEELSDMAPEELEQLLQLTRLAEEKPGWLMIHILGPLIAVREEISHTAAAAIADAALAAQARP